METVLFYQMSSVFFTISTVGVLGSSLFIRLRSALVTRLGVMGTTGEKGWYGLYGTAAPVNGVCMPGDIGMARVKTVSFVVCCRGLMMLGSYARNGREPPVRTGAGALLRWNVWPGLGLAGSDGNLVTPGLGDVGKPTSALVELVEAAETGSGSLLVPLVPAET